MSNILAINETVLNDAASILRAGGLVAFPTETVYGLGGDATNGQAVAKIYAAKGRPSFNPLIIHAADAADFEQLIEWNDKAKALAKAFWPGPLTMILPRKKSSTISLLASAGLQTLAIRVPSNPIALKLLQTAGIPIAAPSANASGQLSPTTAKHVADSLGNTVDMILDGGRTQIGVESTVLNMTTAVPVILRPGGVTQEQIEAVLNEKIEAFSGASDDSAPHSPGMLSSHYAPHIPLRMDAKQALEGEAFLAFGESAQHAELNLSPKGDLHEAAANLFAMLHELDKPCYKGIAVAPIPNKELGIAINDRLKRAAAK